MIQLESSQPALQMVYHPTQAQLNDEIPQVFKDLNQVVKEFKTATGADDRYISMILGALMTEYTNKSRNPISPFK